MNSIKRKNKRMWDKLYNSWNVSTFGIFLGAGATISNNLPSWCKLTKRVSSRDTKFLQQEGISLETQLNLAYKRLGDKWVPKVRSSLYKGFIKQLLKEGITIDNLHKMEMRKARDSELLQYFKRKNPVLVEIVKLCSEDKTPVKAVLTTNIDALLQALDRTINGSPRKLKTVERATKKIRRGKIPLYHLHGFLLPYEVHPKYEAVDQLVLTEEEYVKRNDNPHHWAAVTLHWMLRDSPTIFIGCSMTDSLVRRALFRTKNERAKAHEAEGSSKNFAKHFAVMRYKDKAVNTSLEKSFSLMDVNILWVQDFEADLISKLRKLRKFSK